MPRLLVSIAVAAFVAAPLAAQQPAAIAPTPPSAPAFVQGTQPPPAPPQTAPPAQTGQRGGRGQGQPTTAPPAPPGPTPQTGQGPNMGVRPEAPSTWQNIRIDFVFLDSLGPDGPTRKTVTLLVLEGRSGSIRSANRGTINVDASPSIRPDGRIYLRITVQYQPDFAYQPQQASQPTTGGSLDESLSVVLVDARSMLVSQSADPRSDRKVSLEVTATVIK